MADTDPYDDIALLITMFICDNAPCRARLDYDEPYDPDVFAAKARSLDWYADTKWYVLCPACRRLLNK